MRFNLIPRRLRLRRCRHGHPRSVVTCNLRRIGSGCERNIASGNVTPSQFGPALIRTGDRALWQAFAIARDFARGSDPQAVAMAHNVADGVAERVQAKGLADDEG